MFAATAATFPFAMATSRTALILFLGSMTWPPFKRRSYFCCAETCVIEHITRPIAAVCQGFNLMTLASPIIVPGRTPLRREVLAHVERARHRVACDSPRKTEAQCVTVPLGIRAGDLNG